MTHRLAIVALVAIVAIVGMGCGKTQPSAERIEQTEILVKKLALEAYPQWAVRNPAKTCPDSAKDLVEYMPDVELVDAWKRPLKIYCGANVPAGVRGLGAASFGADGVEGNADDIKSW